MERSVVVKNIIINQILITAYISYLHNALNIQFMTGSKNLATLAKNLFQKVPEKISLYIQYEDTALCLPLIGVQYQGIDNCTLTVDVLFDVIRNVFTGLKNQKIHVKDDDRAEFVDIDE